ncbi:NAD(P)/FAD-dependent oxidoreductase [Caloramator sp. ALD01]|uniref:NAD(P)/FAD-dependent oxidoreductase n=1 Tax=Caloramator sp. ALD01 TaxID=1031288 RepID=UPI00041DF49C|nr:NAD(P)/FAD-dependent oxidoreductase [Caloramator sp. ALD01]
MTIRVNNIRISLDDSIDKVLDIACKMAKVNKKDIWDYKILKESIDARRKNKIDFVYQVEFKCNNESRVVAKANSKDVLLDDTYLDENFNFGDEKLLKRPIIVGTGPAGLFAGLILAKNGYRPIILERGSSVEKRTKDIQNFWNTGELNLDSNVQFGEGGAGTFSDGKLTTRIKDTRITYVLEEFVEAGAPPEIMYSGKPHIGTDILQTVVKNIREKIKSFGGEVKFDSKVTDIIVKDNKIQGVIVNNEYEIDSDVVIFAIGHSARDTYEMLLKRGVEFEQKPFAIGVRIEHLQSMIDENQYGKFAKHPKLKAADYRLTFTSKTYGRPCYSFCMCPGGTVVAAASEENRLVTNGMSEYKRDKDNANSAIVVGVGSPDFASSHPLAGMEFQRYYEELAYKVGGGGYIAPIQLVGDFLKDEVSKKLGKVKPSYTRGYNFANLSDCLPNYVIGVLKEALYDFDKKIKGFASYDAILTGIETRTSAPVKIIRMENFESSTIKGLYPSGEGAGYAGGIMSAAVDGIKTAEKIMQKYAPIE